MSVATTLFLVRHGRHDRLDHILCGRMEGVGLGEAGRREAHAAASRLARGDRRFAEIAALYASPLQRTLETAEIIGEHLGLAVDRAPDLIEVDFGDWTGRAFDALATDPRWPLWNSQRSLHRPPGGESMGEAQIRALRAVDLIRADHPDGGVALVSHSDIIKAIIAHYLGLGLDHIQRFTIDPASISTVVVGGWGAKVVGVNEGVER